MSHLGRHRARAPPSEPADRGPNPGEDTTMKMLNKFGTTLLALLAFASIASAQKWQPLKTPPSFPVGAIGLLSDGTVLLHEEQDSTPQKWYKLPPDSSGSNINRTVTRSDS